MAVIQRGEQIAPKQAGRGEGFKPEAHKEEQGAPHGAQRLALLVFLPFGFCYGIKISHQMGQKKKRWNRKPVISANELILRFCDWNKNGKLTDSFLISTLIKVSLWTVAQPQCTSVTDQVFKESWPKSPLNEKNLISPALKPGARPAPPKRSVKTGRTLATCMINGVEVIFTRF